MFGEDFILGQKIGTIDAKGRIVLPKFTYAQGDDQISLFYSKDKEHLKIFLFERIKKMLELLQDRQLRTADINFMREIQEQINLIHESYIETSYIDNQRRIHIPSDIREELNLDKSVHLLGGTEYSLPCLKIYKI